ncbi:MAG: phage tail protein [Planctomycetota bacterium]
MVFGAIVGATQILSGAAKIFGLGGGPGFNLPIGTFNPDRIDQLGQAVRQTILAIRAARQDIDVVPDDVIERGDDASSVASFLGIQSSYGVGQSVAIVYGEHDTGGQVISISVDRTIIATNPNGNDREELAVLLSLGEGPFESIGGVTRDRNGLTIDTAEFPRGVKVNGIEQGAGAVLSVRLGSDIQTPIPGFEAARSTNQIGGELETSGQLVEFVVPNPDATLLRVRFQLPNGLYRQEASEQFGERVEFTVQWRPRGADSYSSPLPVVIEPGFARPREFSHWFAFAVSTPEGEVRDGYEVLVRRVTQESEGRALEGEFILDSTVLAEVEAVVEQRLAYPGEALLALRVPAGELLTGGQPQFQIPVKSRRVRVFESAVSDEVSEDRHWELPQVGPYAGIWSHAPGRNPAWQALDFIDAVFGLRRHRFVPDLEAFRDWADFCDQTLEEGDPLMRCAHVWDRPERALDVLARIFRAGRAVPVFEGRVIRPLYQYRDAHGRGTNFVPARERVDLVTTDNCSDFQASYVSESQKTNQFDGQFLNADQNFEIDFVSGEDFSAGSQDPFALREAATQKETLDLRGITDKDQVEREVLYRLAINKLQFKRCQFTLPPAMTHLQVGDVVMVLHDQDPPPLGEAAYSAKLLGDSDARTVRLDKPVELEDGETYRILGVQPGGVVVELDLASAAGVYAPGDVLDIDPAETEPGLLAGTVVIVAKVGAKGLIVGVENYQILKLSREADGSRRAECILWSPEAFDADAVTNDHSGVVPLGDPVDPKDKLIQVGAPVASTALAVSSVAPEATDVKVFPGAEKGVSVVSWRMPATFSGRRARVFLDSARGEPQLLGESSDAQLEVVGLDPRSVSRIRVSVETESRAFVPAEQITPTEIRSSEFARSSLRGVLNLQAIAGDRVVMRWDLGGLTDIEHFEVRRGQNWAGANVVAVTQANVLELERLTPLLAHRFMVRPKMRGGLYGALRSVEVVPTGVGSASEMGSFKDLETGDAGTHDGTSWVSGGHLILDGLQGSYELTAYDFAKTEERLWLADFEWDEIQSIPVSAFAGVRLDDPELRWRTTASREPTLAQPGAVFERISDFAGRSIESLRRRVGAPGVTPGRNTRCDIFVSWRDAGGAWSDFEPFVPQRRNARGMRLRLELWRRSPEFQIHVRRIIGDARVVN